MEPSNHRKVTFKAEDMKYPSSDDIKFADSKCPKFSNFGFEDKYVLISVLQGKPINEASIEDNLYWWDLVLKNRFGSLRGAYFDALTHYRRGFKEDYRDCSDAEMINRLLFDNNAEIFYYFFFVTADVIAQILNLYFQLDIAEDKIYFNEKLIQKIKEPVVKSAIRIFYHKTETARKYRNGFTHRFPTNYPDYRTKIEDKEGKTVLHGGSGEFAPPGKIIKNIEDSLVSLSVLLEELKHIINSSELF